jgi:1-phosphatidylinositol-3-phosphate 5-kinase
VTTLPNSPQNPRRSETTRSGFSTGIALVMKQILSTGESTPPPVPRKNHHGLLSLEPGATNDRPHIKYDWTVGKRLKFSCTVYYAKQFDILRKRCGIEATYLKSVEKSANWLAEGGKSRSNFWKTADDRFIIKTLVDAWNVADL